MASMLNSLEMIIQFLDNISKEDDIEIPPRMTWMDGLQHGLHMDDNDLLTYSLKILFVLMCSP